MKRQAQPEISEDGKQALDPSRQAFFGHLAARKQAQVSTILLLSVSIFTETTTRNIYCHFIL